LQSPPEAGWGRGWEGREGEREGGREGEGGRERANFEKSRFFAMRKPQFSLGFLTIGIGRPAIITFRIKLRISDSSKNVSFP